MSNVAGLALALGVAFLWLITAGSDCLLATFGWPVIVAFWLEIDDRLASSKSNGLDIKCERSVKDERAFADVALRDLVAIFGNRWDRTLAGP